MYRLCAVVIEELDRFAKLRAPYNGVIHEEQFFALDELCHRDLLHLRDLVPLSLRGRHEAAGPRRRVFYERSGERQVCLVGVSDRMRCAAVRHSAYIIEL